MVEKPDQSRAPVSAELGFIGYVEGIHLATNGGMHAEGAAAAEHDNYV